MKNKIGYLLIALPIVSFLFITIWYSQNIPYNDDYPAILSFLMHLKKAGSTSEALQLYFAPYSEHRIFFVRFFSWLQLTLFGHLNFKMLPLIGNLSFIAGFFILFKSAKLDKDKKPLYLAPSAFFLFQLQSWSNNIWSMASLSNTMILFWVILALYYLFKQGNTKYFIFGLLFAIFATYTNGNGVFVLFAAAITFLCQKKYARSLITLMLFIALFLINVMNTNGSGSIIDKMVHQGIPKIIGMCLVFLGSNFFHPSYIFVALGIGLAFILLFAYLFFVKKYYFVNPISFSLYLFIFITAFAVAAQRDILDISTVAPSRYRVYCTLLIVLSYIALLEVFPKLRSTKLVGYLALPLAILFFLGSNYVALGKIENRSALNRSYMFLLDNKIPLGEIDSTYYASIKENLLKPSDISISSLVVLYKDAVHIGAKDTSIIYHIDTIGNKGSYIFIKGWAGRADDGNSLNSIYTVVYSKGNTKVYKANFLEVPKFINDKKMIRYATCGFLSAVPLQEYNGADSVAIGLSRDVTSNKHIATFYFPEKKVAYPIK